MRSGLVWSGSLEEAPRRLGRIGAFGDCRCDRDAVRPGIDCGPGVAGPDATDRDDG